MAQAPADCEFALWEGLGGLPLFSPDLDQPDAPLPASVHAFHRQVDAAQGLLIACPEYAHGIPGAFKNALDWLVGSTTFPGKPVALWNVSPRAHHAQDQLREVLSTMSAEIVEEGCCSAAFPKEGEPVEEFQARLMHALEAFADWLRQRLVSS